MSSNINDSCIKEDNPQSLKRSRLHSETTCDDNRIEIGTSAKKMKLELQTTLYDNRKENGVSAKKMKLELETKLYDNRKENGVSAKKMMLELENDIFNSRLFDEIVIKVFGYLDYKDLLMAASLVCSRWKVLSQSPELWRNLYLRGRLHLKTETVERLLKLSNGVQHINLSRCELIEDSVILEIAKQNQLKTLNINRVISLYSLSSISYRCQLLSRNILGTIAHCRSLERLSLHYLPLTDDALGKIAESCTNLTELDISECMSVTEAGLLPVIQHCTQLKSLTIDYCRKVEDDFLIALASMPNQIEYLNISRCKFSEEGLKYLGKLPKLRRLYARIVKTMRDNVVSVFSNLTVIWLERILGITSDGISTIVRKNPNLELFTFSDCIFVDDTALEMISKSPCRSTLTSLKIDCCPVSETGIHLILQNCTKLKLLVYSKIPEVSSIDRWRIEYPHIKVVEV